MKLYRVLEPASVRDLRVSSPANVPAAITGRRRWRAWGFKPLSEIVWRKLTATGKPRIGTGYRVRTMHEPILVASPR